MAVLMESALLFFFIKCLVHSNGQEAGLSMVLEDDQILHPYSYTVTIGNWSSTNNPGLYSNLFNKNDNSKFHIPRSGVYYVTANLILETKNRLTHYYYWWRRYRRTTTLHGEIYLRSSNGGYIRYNKKISTFVTMKQYQEKNLHISGYIQLEQGWELSIRLYDRYGWKKTVKAGSTLSMSHASSSYLFPGVLLASNYEYIYLRSPQYSSFLNEWSEIDEGSSLNSTEGNIMVFHEGLYHILVNLNIRRYISDETLKFGVILNNKTTVIEKQVKVDVSGYVTVILEEILLLNERDVVAITVSSPNKRNENVRVQSSSKFFIFSKGEFLTSIPALSVQYKSNDKTEAANITLNNWDTSFSQNGIRHFKNVELKNREFVAPKTGIYQHILQLYLSNCSKTSARLSIRHQSQTSFHSITPSDIRFNNESQNCTLQNSMLLHLKANDSLKIELKSETRFKILPKTMYQVVYNIRHSLWPAAIFDMSKRYPFHFHSNSGPSKIRGWAIKIEGNWNDHFFDSNNETVTITNPGLYIISYNLIIHCTTAGGQLISEVVLNDSTIVEGGKCVRGNVPLTFTCTASTLLYLSEKQNLSIQVSMTESQGKQTVYVKDHSRFTLALLSDTRSHPAFKMQVLPFTHVTKAGKKQTVSLSNQGIPNVNYFRSGAISLNSANSFTNTDGGYYLLSNIQFSQKNDGKIASTVGSDVSSIIYSKDHKKSNFSMTGSDLTLEKPFYFNVTAQAGATDLKWQLNHGSVVSGLHLGKNQSLTAIKAQLKTSKTLLCSEKWTSVDVLNWNIPVIRSKNLGEITSTGFQLMKGGFYLASLNFAVQSNTSNTIINVGVFIDGQLILTGSETTPNDGSFSIFLDGVLDLRNDQHIGVEVRCSQPTTVTYAKGGGISLFKVDETQPRPSMRRRMYSYSYYSYYGNRKVGAFYASSSQTKGNFEQFQDYITRNGWRFKTVRSGLYLVSIVGSKNSYAKSYEVAFSSPANASGKADYSLVKCSPLYYISNSPKRDKDNSVMLTGIVSLQKEHSFGLLYKSSYSYYNYYSSRMYMSVQYLGEEETSSGFMATLQKDIVLKSGKTSNNNFWSSGSSCGRYTTSRTMHFKEHNVLYSGYYIVSMNVVLHNQKHNNFHFCFTINGKPIPKVGAKDLNLGCFYEQLVSNKTSSMSGTEILYLKENSKLSVEWLADEDLTISKRSSFSVYYLGTSGGILGFNSVSNAVKLEKLPSYSRHHYYYYYYDSNNNYNQFKVTGWITSLSKSPMVFQTRMRFPVEDLFIAPRNGIYMVTTKLHVQNDVVLEGTCHVKLQISVDGDVLDFVHKKELNQSLTTLTITTSLELEKWQGVAVHFSFDRIYCHNINVLPGGVFSVIYLDSAKQEFTLWPNPGPHIVEFPAEATVYVREDKRTSLVKCRAVGDSENIKYQWKTDDDKILGESSTLDTTKIGRNSNYVKCVANMNGLLEESKFITVVSIDPTVQFTDTYSNRIYYLPEKNETHKTGYENVMEFGVKENKTSSYYWYWTRKIRCSITKGNMSTFFISRKYSYYSGGDGEFFTLRAKVEKLDREVHDKYVLEITCVNTEYTDAPSAVTNITIEILDYNDNVPVFEKKIYFKKISKNIKPGEEIVQVIANDDDIKENGKISYSLKLDSNSYIFTIDKQYGFISLKANEKLSQRSYRLTVIATDQGKPPRKGFVTVVLDVQEGPVTDNNYPVFYKHQYEARLYLGVPKDTYVTTVRAHDPNTFDDQQINYFMLSSGLENFKVNESNGEITTKKKLTEPRYDFMVGAEYSKRSTHMEHGFYNTTKVVVYANYLDTTIPRFTEQIYHGKMKEDKKVGAILNVRVKANYNNKNVQYSLSENEKMFEIDGTSGEITLAKPLDYEKEKLHFFIVTASSSEANHVKKEGFSIVVVHVLDVNDNAPIFKSYPRKVDVKLGQGYQEIGQVYANDEDDGKNGKVGYYLAHDFNGLFSINTTNGSLYFNGGQLLQVADNYLYIIVIARDEGNPYNESTVVIHVTLHNPTPPTTVEPPTTVAPNTTATERSNASTFSNGSKGSSGHNNTILIVSLVGGFVLLIALILGFVFRRRCTSNRQAATAMTYIRLPPDEEDEELLDVEGVHETGNNERRLSLISSASDENLLKNQ